MNKDILMITIVDKEIFALQNKIMVWVTDLFLINYILYFFYHALYYLFTYLMPSDYQGFWGLDQVTSLYLMLPYL